jgi:hypothetical protein
MSSAIRTVDNFLDSVKSTGSIPENQVRLTPERILAFADEETLSTLTPLIDSVNQEFFIVQEDIPILASQAEYWIPYRSIGRKLRDIKLSDGSTVRSLTKIALEDAHYYNLTGSPAAFYPKSDKVVIVPTPTAAGMTLQLFYGLRPSRLVQTTSAAQITGISGAILTLSNMPATFVATELVDTIHGKSGYVNIDYDLEISNVSGTQLTLSDIPTGIEIGDWVSLQQTTPLIQFPDEAYTFLVLRTARRCLKAIGDIEGAKDLDEDILSAKKNLLQLLDPRIEGASTIIINRNGLLRSYRQLRYYRGITS